MGPLTIGNRTWAYHGLLFPKPLWFVVALVKAGVLVRLAYEWRSRNSEITITIIKTALLSYRRRT